LPSTGVAFAGLESGGPAELGDRQADTEGRSLFRTATSKKDPENLRRIQRLRESKPAQNLTAAATFSYAHVDKDKVWEPKAVGGKFGPAELGDRQDETTGRSLFRHHPGAKTEAAKKNKDVKFAAQDVQKILEGLSSMQRSSLFPGSIGRMPLRSVTQEMLEQCRPFDPEYRVDKTHMPKKYDMKIFMEAEFKRRLLYKATLKESTA